MIGEFHGILTLDSAETVKAIIPECIQIPPGLLTHTFWQTPLSSWQATERIAFAIVPDEVRYPDRIVGIALLLWG